MLKNRLRSLDDMMKIKEEKLRGRSKDTYAAIQWLRQNKHIFSGNVYEPMMLVVRARYRDCQRYRDSQGYMGLILSIYFEVSLSSTPPTFLCCYVETYLNFEVFFDMLSTNASFYTPIS